MTDPDEKSGETEKRYLGFTARVRKKDFLKSNCLIFNFSYLANRWLRCKNNDALCNLNMFSVGSEGILLSAHELISRKSLQV